MKRTIVIAGAVVLLILAVRIFFKTENEFEGERLTYARNLNYHFSASVDSITFLNKNNDRGFLVCKLTDGKPDNRIEDNLNRKLRNHEWMRFMFFNPRGHIQIFRENISKFNVGDSVYVNSDADQFYIYRNKKIILETSVSLAVLHKVSWASWLKNQ